MSVSMHLVYVRQMSLLLLLPLLIAVVACGAPSTAAITTSTPAQSVTAQPQATDATSDVWQTYINTELGFTLPVPADWTIAEGAGGIIWGCPDFPSVEGQAASCGGVDILGRHGDTEDVQYAGAIHNHSQVLEQHLITTPAGPGRLYTLKHDLATETPDGLVWSFWWNQYALIPAGDRFYNIWIQIDPNEADMPVAILARMLAEFRLTSTEGNDVSPVAPVEGVVELVEDGAMWKPRDPYGKPSSAPSLPLAASDAHGTLFVQFPPFEGAGFERHAVGDYEIIYIPKGQGGTARWVLTLPGRVPTEDPGERVDPYDDQYIGRITAIGNGRFLLHTYTTCCGAQNGTLTRIWWIDPGNQSAKVVAGGRYGGGNFTAMARNERWLFWNSVRTGETVRLEKAEAWLINLQVGLVRSLDLGGQNWTWERARWGDDGLLHFPLDYGGPEYTLDPETGHVDALLPSKEAAE